MEIKYMDEIFGLYVSFLYKAVINDPIADI